MKLLLAQTSFLEHRWDQSVYCYLVFLLPTAYLKETRNSSKIQPLDFEKKGQLNSEKNVLQNTNEHTCEYLCYISLQICLG